MFESASEVIGYDLLKVCAEGPEATLHSTAVSQPAIFVASFAATHLLEQALLRESDPPLLENVNSACGLSLGEYSALAAAHAFSFEDGVALVDARGKAMEMALSAAPSSTMVNVTGLDEEVVIALCAEAQQQSGEPVSIANFLHQKNYTLSGGSAACEAVCDLAMLQYVDTARTTPLQVGGAFHSAYVESAEALLREALDSVTLHPPAVPVLSNVDACMHTTPERTKELLVRQLTAPVQWEATIRELLRLDALAVANATDRTTEGNPPLGPLTWYELGPGRVLSAILKRIHRRSRVVQIAA
jgi:[acyl-carrier-protein] S-malonyltransferase